jgi:SAM-dependent methyltransferase
MKVLDAGCGEGVLSVMMAKKGAFVTGCDISRPNIENCKKYAKENNVEIEFLTSDLEKLPFEEGAFDMVVSSHVLEHLPSFDVGLNEVMRVSKKRAVIAIPTLLNPCSLTQVGHGWFFLKGLKSFSGLFVGCFKMVLALLLKKDGVDETYVGKGVPHVFRFPWVMKKKAKKYNFDIVYYEASSICMPYFTFLLPIVQFLDQFKGVVFLRNFGYGTTYVLEKKGLFVKNVSENKNTNTH